MQLFMGARQLRMEASARDLGLYLPAPRRRAKAVKGGERGRSLSQLISVVYKNEVFMDFLFNPFGVL